MSRHLDWEEPLFDQPAYARSVRMALAEHNLSFREAAPQIGISHATLHRVAKCVGPPDVESYFRINRWLSDAPVSV
jgi:hypothetical protein